MYLYMYTTCMALIYITKMPKRNLYSFNNFLFLLIQAENFEYIVVLYLHSHHRMQTSAPCFHRATESETKNDFNQYKIHSQ